MELTQFWTLCSSNSIILELGQLHQFERYCTELIYWNEKVNLISRKDLDNIFERHFLHSLSIIKYVDLKKKAQCIDIGTGGGFPGIPLAIARPDLKMLMVDSIAKKIKLTSMFAEHTGIRDLKAMRTRVEDLHSDIKFRNKFDYVFARAVTEAKYLLNWSDTILKPDGKIILLKGGNLKKEIEDASKLFSNFEFEEIPVSMIGSSWFSEEEKKILICKRK